MEDAALSRHARVSEEVVATAAARGTSAIADLPYVRIADAASTDAHAADKLATGLGPGPFALVSIFASPDADFPTLMAQAATRFEGATVLGCTTAGEVGPKGYVDSTIEAIGLPAADFSVQPVAIANLAEIDTDAVVGEMIRARANLIAQAPQHGNEFAFLLVDGLSLREDALVSALMPGLGPVPLFGGSAGDGERFGKTMVALNGRVMPDAAVLCLIRTRCEVEVFSLNHLTPTSTRMVVTEADPASRTVRQINGEPAAREYARLLGKDPEQLDTFTFAAHPVVVRMGSIHHVRAIQQVKENGDLVFFSAIDTGLVLTLATPENMVEHLNRELGRMCADRKPEALWVCDCILRRVEAQQKQQSVALSDVLSRYRAVGFSTYGEQINGTHVNQTMTGVAIYPPRSAE